MTRFLPRFAAALCLLSAATAVHAAPTIYGLDLRNDRFVQFDGTTPGTQTLIGAQSANIYGLDFNSAATTLYALTDIGQFGTIDLVTGAFTATTTLTGLDAGHGYTGLRIDPTSETFYVSSAVVGNSTLYTLNPLTGALSRVGTITGASLVIDIAINGAGQMFAVDIATDTLLSVDKATGAGATIGSVGQALNFAQGMDFDYASGNLYATFYRGGGATDLVTIDTATGAATVIPGLVSGEYEMAVASAAAAVTVPEAGTFALALPAMAMVGAVLIKRRKK